MKPLWEYHAGTPKENVNMCNHPMIAVLWLLTCCERIVCVCEKVIVCEKVATEGDGRECGRKVGSGERECAKTRT